MFDISSYKNWFLIIPLLNVALSSGIHNGQQENFNTTFEIGAGIGYFMPRTDFSNSHSFTMGGLWKMSPSYGIRFTILNTQLYQDSGDSSRHFLQFGPGVEFSFKSREKVKGYTLIDVGFIDDEKDALFIFGIGMKYKMNEKYSMNFELRDYHKGVGIPFVTFPRSQAGIRGEGGSKYLDFQMRLHYLL